MPEARIAPLPEDVEMNIADRLGDSCLSEASIEYIQRPSAHFCRGVYVHYRISKSDPIDRAVYLGQTSAQVQKAFDKFIRKWEV